MSRERTANGASTGAPPVGVLTVDDQAVFRAAAREVIEATPGFEAVGEAASAEEALTLLETVDPGLVLVDVRMPGIDGVEAARRIKALRPAAVVVLVSMEEPVEGATAGPAAGAVAFVPKQKFGPATLRRVWHAHGSPR